MSLHIYIHWLLSSRILLNLYNVGVFTVYINVVLMKYLRLFKHFYEQWEIICKSTLHFGFCKKRQVFSEKAVMRLFKFIFTIYFLVVFLSSTCGKSRNKLKSKKNTWRLRLLRKLSGRLYPNVTLLSLKNKHHSLPGDNKGRIHLEDSSRKHVPVIRKYWISLRKKIVNLKMNWTLNSNIQLTLCHYPWKGNLATAVLYLNRVVVLAGDLWIFCRVVSFCVKNVHTGTSLYDNMVVKIKCKMFNYRWLRANIAKFSVILV